MTKPRLHLLKLENCPIFKQLQLEEAWLRSDERNICLINFGSEKTIVKGISGDLKELLHLEKVKEDRIPVLKRFSGGGTVVVDQHTLFITFIFQKEALDISPFPEPIHRWMGDLYTQAWQIPQFHFRENDFCIGEKKCGGNAQYIQKDRWLHHTSFLWDFEEGNMNYLKLPPKRPTYRKDRNHRDFLCTLKEFAKEPKSLIQKLEETLVKRFYIEPLLEEGLEGKEYRKTVEKIILR